jgi:hypothetical protein
MPQLEAQARVLEEWFRLPESRRMHATDAVAFAFRLLQDRPEMVARLPIHNDAANHDIIVSWLLPYLNRQGELDARIKYLGYMDVSRRRGRRATSKEPRSFVARGARQDARSLAEIRRPEEPG